MNDTIRDKAPFFKERPGEVEAAKALDKAGAIIFQTNHTGEGPSWFVGLGSHGGSAATLKTAMRRCLHCCDVGMFWKMHGVSAADVFSVIAVKHLGGWTRHGSAKR